MITVLGIAGSLRRESFNRRLLAAAAAELPAGARLEIYPTLATVPLFDEDAESAPVPPEVDTLRRAIAAADGLLVSTPEYNGSLSGVLKNAIDWASRPYGSGVLTGKPAAVLGASPSPHGALWAQQDLRRVLGIAGADVVDGLVPVSEAFRRFDENGELLAGSIRTDIRALLTDLNDGILARTTAA